MNSVFNKYFYFLVYFTQQPEDITVQENEIVNITCLYNGTTRPPIWIINGITYTLLDIFLDPTYHFRSPYSIYFESTYLLQSTSYQCQVSDEDQIYRSQIGYLTVGEQVSIYDVVLQNAIITVTQCP